MVCPLHFIYLTLQRVNISILHPRFLSLPNRNNGALQIKKKPFYKENILRAIFIRYMPQNVFKNSSFMLIAKFDRRVADLKLAPRILMSFLSAVTYYLDKKKLCTYLKHVSFQASVLFTLKNNSVCLRALMYQRYYICSDKQAVNSVLTSYTRNASDAK